MRLSVCALEGEKPSGLEGEGGLAYNTCTAAGAEAEAAAVVAAAVVLRTHTYDGCTVAQGKLVVPITAGQTESVFPVDATNNRL